MTIETHNWASSAHQEFHKIVRDEIFPIVNQVHARVQNFELQFLKEATKFVGDFKSLTKEADDSLAKHKALELEIERLLRVVVSQDVMNIVQKESVVDTSDLQTELERTKERFENCIIKKETEYAKLWNDWYKKCDECKYDKISYDKAYKDMQQTIKRLQAQLGDLKEFQVLNYARENAHLKATYKNLFDSISVSRTQTKTIIASLQNELKSNIYKNAKLRTQLFKKVSDQKNNTQDTSKNTKFAKQPIVENLPKISETNALSKPVTSSSVSTSQESKGVDNTKTRRPQLRRNTKHDRVPSTSKSSRSKNKEAEVEEHHRNLLLSKNNKHISSAFNNIQIDSQDVIQICLWCIDSGCSKHMTGNLKLLINFIWKFMGTVRFKNDHVATILGFGDLQWGNILITRVYFIEGLGHNLFSVGQFCDSDLEVAFRRDACFVRNLEGVDLLKGDCSTNLYTINLHEMASASPICLMARASSTKSCLWHQRLSHLNFDTINDLARNDLIAGLPKFKYHKEHLCPSCEQGKSKRASHPPKPVPNSRQRLHLLHMDLCGPIRIASINDKRISHQMSSVRSPQQNGVVERRNQTLVEAVRTMLIFSHAPLFLWAEAIVTACFTQNRSIIHRRFNKTPYELINDRKPDILFLHVFGALCYPKNDREDIRKLGAKGDIGFFIGGVGVSVGGCDGVKASTAAMPVVVLVGRDDGGSSGVVMVEVGAVWLVRVAEWGCFDGGVGDGVVLVVSAGGGGSGVRERVAAGGGVAYRWIL
nr:retrovirus-related Pol polyprotein from transposon TNT 1-94 [Tanacetum cinerariifolium]